MMNQRHTPCFRCNDGNIVFHPGLIALHHLPQPLRRNTRPSGYLVPHDDQLSLQRRPRQQYHAGTALASNVAHGSTSLWVGITTQDVAAPMPSAAALPRRRSGALGIVS
jgi:hypothetical protein